MFASMITEQIAILLKCTHKNTHLNAQLNMQGRPHSLDKQISLVQLLYFYIYKILVAAWKYLNISCSGLENLQAAP